MNTYPNIMKAANEIFEDFTDFKSGKQRYLHTFKIVTCIGKTQSGKTALQQQIAYLLGGEKQWIFACTTYSNKEIVLQHELDMDGYNNVIPFKISTIVSPTNQHPYNSLKEDIKKSTSFGNILFLMIDESEYRVGHNSILDKLIRKLSDDFPQLRIYILLVGATPMSMRALETQLNIPFKHFLLEPGDGYIGLEELLDMGNVFDTSHISTKDEKFSPHEDILDKLDYKIKEFSTGLFMMRARGRTAKQAEYWRDALTKRYSDLINKNTLSIFTAHTDNPESIRETIKKAERECMWDRVIMILVGGLSAGYRLFSNPGMKEHIHFAYEPSKKHMTAVQGLGGRATGYYKPMGSGPTICMDVEAIESYSQLFDLDRMILPHKNASTHTSGAAVRKRKFTPCEVVGDYDIDGKYTNFKIAKDLGLIPQGDGVNVRISTDSFYDFDGQWENSNSDNPNYNIISYTADRKTRPFALMIDRRNNKARIVKKTGDETNIFVPYHNSKSKNTSMFSENPFSDFNEEKNK